MFLCPTLMILCPGNDNTLSYINETYNLENNHKIQTYMKKNKNKGKKVISLKFNDIFDVVY